MGALTSVLLEFAEEEAKRGEGTLEKGRNPASSVTRAGGYRAASPPPPQPV